MLTFISKESFKSGIIEPLKQALIVMYLVHYGWRKFWNLILWKSLKSLSQKSNSKIYFLSYKFRLLTDQDDSMTFTFTCRFFTGSYRPQTPLFPYSPCSKKFLNVGLQIAPEWKNFCQFPYHQEPSPWLKKCFLLCLQIASKWKDFVDFHKRNLHLGWRKFLKFSFPECTRIQNYCKKSCLFTQFLNSFWP